MELPTMTMMMTLVTMTNHFIILVSTEKDILFLISSNDADTQNTLGKESGYKKIAEIDTQDAAATDKDTTESGKATNNDVSDKSDHESATTSKPDAAGNNKRTAMTIYR